MKAVVPAALQGARAERVARELFDLSRGSVRRLCEAGRVRVAGRRVKKGDALRAGDEVELVGGSAWLVPDPSTSVPILVESPSVLVVNKPGGMPCHPLVPGEGGTLVDVLVARYPEIATASADAREAGLVHRLDTDTSGCVGVARDPATWRALRDAFDAGTVEKVYLALVWGRVEHTLVTDAAIDHDPGDARRMTIGAGRAAHTRADPVVAGPSDGRPVVSLVRVVADRGRRHQVRVHLASLGHPLVGDVLYGGAGVPGLAGHALHAWELALPHIPRARAPVPTPFAAAAAALGCPVPVL